MKTYKSCIPFLCTVFVWSLSGCSESGGASDSVGILASGLTAGGIENDLEVGAKIWEEHGFMTGSNVECWDGDLVIWVDQDGSKDFEGNDLPSEAGGIVFSLDQYDSIVNRTYEIELELPAAFPAFENGVGVAQTFGVFEKNPEKIHQQRGAFVNYGFCPGAEQFNSPNSPHAPLGDHHFSFGGQDEVIMNSVAADMGFGPLDADLVRQTATIKLEIKSDSIEFSANGEEPYHVEKSDPGEAAGSEFELRVMTHAATVAFGNYDPTGAPYTTLIKSIKIDDVELPLCQR